MVRSEDKPQNWEERRKQVRDAETGKMMEEKNRKKESIMWVGKSIREARKALQGGSQSAERKAKHRLYHLHPGSKVLQWRYEDTRKLPNCLFSDYHSKNWWER